MNRDRGNGFEVRLGDLVFSVSSALDLVSPEVVGHHLRVARIARAIAARTRLLPGSDAGPAAGGGVARLRRFFVARTPGDHAVRNPASRGSRRGGVPAAEVLSALRAGGRDRSLPPSAVGAPPRRTVAGAAGAARQPPAASGGQGQRSGGRPAGRRGPGQGHVAGRSESGSGSRFNPEFVEALEAAAGRPGFWGEVAAAGDDDLRNDPAFGEVTLSEADFRGLARVFWQIVDFRSRFTATHTSGVTAVAGFLAPLAGVTGAAGRMVAISAGLHDLGKLAVPSETLEKEARAHRARKSPRCAATRCTAGGYSRRSRAWRRSTSGRTTTTSGSTARGTPSGSRPRRCRSKAGSWRWPMFSRHSPRSVPTGAG